MDKAYDKNDKKNTYVCKTPSTILVYEILISKFFFTSHDVKKNSLHT